MTVLPDRYTETQKECNNNVIVTEVFKLEPVTWQSFSQNNLDYLDFPLWLSLMVDKRELSKLQFALSSP